MRLTRLATVAAATATLIGSVAASAVVASGPAGAATTPAASSPAKAASATTLISSSGATITPQAAARLVGANSQGHAAYAPKSLASASKTPAVSPHSIIGADSRTQVTATTSYPNSAIVLIRQNGGLWCTGWMISKDTLLSAGHCVTNGSGTWYSGLTFTPGSNGGNAPFGTCSARGIWSFNAWINGANSNYDASIIKLNCTVGYSTGWFGTWWQSASPNGLFTRVQGYPGDKPSTQWQSFDFVRASTADRLLYQNDTIGGESGSPVWQYRSGQSFCNGACAMGIHTNGSDGTNNSGTRFTQGKLTSIYAIVNQP